VVNFVRRPFYCIGVVGARLLKIMLLCSTVFGRVDRRTAGVVGEVSYRSASVRWVLGKGRKGYGRATGANSVLCSAQRVLCSIKEDGVVVDETTVPFFAMV